MSAAAAFVMLFAIVVPLLLLAGLLLAWLPDTARRGDDRLYDGGDQDLWYLRGSDE